MIVTPGLQQQLAIKRNAKQQGKFTAERDIQRYMSSSWLTSAISSMISTSRDFLSNLMVCLNGPVSPVSISRVRTKWSYLRGDGLMLC